MSTSDRGPIANPDQGDIPLLDAKIDSALRAYCGSLDSVHCPADLTDRIMLQVRGFRQEASSGQAFHVRRFMELVTGRPDLQSQLKGHGTLDDVVWQLQRIAREAGLSLPKSAAYALIVPPAATVPSDELSDLELDGVSAGVGMVSFGIQLGIPSTNGEYSWAFNPKGWQP